jgi:iron complex outermembrane receptor protein
LRSDGGWEAALWGRNLADEDYFQDVFPSQDLGIQSGIAGAPRTWGVSFTYNIN